MQCCRSDWPGLCFVVINPRVLSANRVDLGLFVSSVLQPPPPGGYAVLSLRQYSSLKFPSFTPPPQSLSASLDEWVSLWDSSNLHNDLDITEVCGDVDIMEVWGLDIMEV